MAKYEMTYRCGHAGETNVTGTPEKREIKLADERTRFAAMDCQKCRDRAELDALYAMGMDAEAAALIKARQRKNGRRGAAAVRRNYGEEVGGRIIRDAKAGR